MDDKTLVFDQNGYLTPYGTVKVEWGLFVRTFTHNDHRQNLLGAYEDFLISLSDILPVSHRQWIDGSFISQKSEPGDIDIIVFVPNSHFADVTDNLKQLKSRFKGLIDCYFVEIFPPDHSKFEIGLSDELDWYHFLRTDRRKRLKGTLELWYDYGNK